MIIYTLKSDYSNEGYKDCMKRELFWWVSEVVRVRQEWD